jgi:protein-L-isoaspartate(D-aspartate) O-methyltransferase
MPRPGRSTTEPSARLGDLRRFYARLVASNAGVNDPRIIDAFACVARERFVGSGPWQIRTANGYLSTETDDPAVLYQDILVGLVPLKGIHNGEPSLHAKCLAAVAPQSGDTVIHIGAGSGYYTAMLAHLVGAAGRVHAFEIEPELARRARQNLADWCCVHELSAVDTRLLPSADVIYVSAGVTHVPPHWLDALKPRGRLLLPLTPTHGLGCMLLIRGRDGMTYPARAISPAAFIPCVGANDEGESLRLATAFHTRSPDVVRSLRRGVQADETAWYAGEGWWLSTSDADDDRDCLAVGQP